MLTWIKKAYSKLPREYGNILLYCTLTGLRPDEACKSIELIHNDLHNYFNKETMTIEHFRYPEIFIRRTKKAFFSVMTKNVLRVAHQCGNYNYTDIKRVTKSYGIEMRMSYCRKIFATYLRTKGIETETIDLLQGRTPRSIFAKHYFRPDLNYSNLRIFIDSIVGTVV